MVKVCSHCQKNISWYAYSEDIGNNKIICADCSREKENKLKEKKEHIKIVQGPSYSFGLIILGIILIALCVYVAFFADSGVYYTSDLYHMSYYEAQSVCNNPIIHSYAQQTVQKNCADIPHYFLYSIIGLVIGIIITIIGIVKNFIIFSKYQSSNLK